MVNFTLCVCIAKKKFFFKPCKEKRKKGKKQKTFSGDFEVPRTCKLLAQSDPGRLLGGRVTELRWEGWTRAGWVNRRGGLQRKGLAQRQHCRHRKHLFKVPVRCQECGSQAPSHLMLTKATL